MRRLVHILDISLLYHPVIEIFIKSNVSDLIKQQNYYLYQIDDLIRRSDHTELWPVYVYPSKANFLPWTFAA